MSWPCFRRWPGARAMSSLLSRSAIDLAALMDSVVDEGQGGLASFLGVVRNHQDGKGVVRLEYVAYEAMAETEARRIVAEAESRWPVRVALTHRVGTLAIGEAAIGVVAAGAHRSEAFDACRYVVEEVKRRVPIWKKETYADGTVAWVDPTARPAVAEVESR